LQKYGLHTKIVVNKEVWKVILFKKLFFQSILNQDDWNPKMLQTKWSSNEKLEKYFLFSCKVVNFKFHRGQFDLFLVWLDIHKQYPIDWIYKQADFKWVDWILLVLRR